MTVNPTTDATTESNETVVLTIAAGSGYTAGSPNSAVGTIVNDDSGPAFTRYQIEPDGTVGTFQTGSGEQYEMGTAFNVTEDSDLYSIKFYRHPSGDTSARTWTTRLWNGSRTTKTLIASATVTTTTGQSGWVEAVFATPVRLSRGVDYEASYSVPTSVGYQALTGFFTGAVDPAANPLTSQATSGRFNAVPGSAPSTNSNTYYVVTPVIQQPITTPPYDLISRTTIGVREFDDLGQYEMGTAFTVTANSTVTGVGYFCGFPINQGAPRTITARLWNSGGTQLGTGTYTTVVGDYGWINVPLSAGVAITPGTTYIVSIGIPSNTTYWTVAGAFTSAVTNAAPNPLGAPINAGRFITTPGSFPTTATSAYYTVQPIVT